MVTFLDYFYPRHYLENVPTEFDAIRHELDGWFTYVMTQYQLYLEKLLIINCSDETYLNEVLKSIHVPLLSGTNQIRFMMSKKSVFTIHKLVELLHQYLFEEDIGIQIQTVENCINVNLQFPDSESLQQAEPSLSFLNHYLYQLVSVNYMISVNGYYHGTIGSFAGHEVQEYHGNTILQLRYKE